MSEQVTMNVIHHNEPIRRMNRNDTEHVCLTCDGAGLMPYPENNQSWQVSICKGCNGHGVIVYNNQHGVMKYSIDQHKLNG